MTSYLNLPEEGASNFINDDLSTSSKSSSYLSAEWADQVDSDGSLVYIESYVSSTVKEKQEYSAIRAAAVNRNVQKPKNIKRQSKLLNLLKRRPSVRVKTNHLSVNEGSRTASNQQKNINEPSPPKVTFRDDPNGQSRIIYLEVTTEGNNYGRRASLCERVLGILPGHFSEPPDLRVMVAGLTPGSQALREGYIKIGDWLKKINEQEITWEILDHTLLEINVPSTISLIVQKCASETVHEEESGPQKKITQTQLVKLLIQKNFLETSEKITTAFPLHCVLFLSFSGVTESSPEGADIKYQYPSTSNKLLQARGMLVTADHSLFEITGCNLSCSSVYVDEIEYHVGFSREDDGVLLIVVPDSFLSTLKMIELTMQISQLLCFKYGSLLSAFGSTSNKPAIDHLIGLVFMSVFATVFDGTDSFSSGMPNLSFNEYGRFQESLVFGAPLSLIIKDELALMQIETCLNELESGDFGDGLDCDECQLLYNILGGCIFYKGHLVSSHLSAASLKEVWLFLHHHRLLHLTSKEAVSQLIMWKRVYMSEETPEEIGPITQHLLVVAMNHVLLAVLLESGNVTELIEESYGPDVFLVDQAETTLYHCHSLHLPTIWEESLTSGGIETLIVDETLKDHSSQKQINLKNADQSKLPDVPSILKQKSSHVSEVPLQVLQRADSEPSFDDDDASRFREETKVDTETDSDMRIWKGQEGRISYEAETLTDNEVIQPIKVTIGDKNILFHAVQIDCSDGIIIAPHHHIQPHFPLHAELLRKFHDTCSHIRHVLHTSYLTKNSGDNYVCASPLSGIKEYGIMFTYSIPASTPKKKKPTTLTYWVIGRLYGLPYQREVYVCFEDSTPQNIQEIAFKISLGTM